MTPFESLDALIQIAGAMLLGGLLGYEREQADKPAGLRTHMLVAGASALLVVLGNTIVDQFAADPETSSAIRSDPIRIFEAIFVGVSFLGAGTIWKGDGERSVRGLTTAASLLFTATLGIAMALRLYLLAVVVTLLVVLVMRGLYWFGARISEGDPGGG